MQPQRELVLLTLSYPFGKGESFIENEIEYLAKAFHKVYVIPSDHRHEGRRVVPNNVEVITHVSEQLKKFTLKSVLGFAPFLIRAYIYSIAKSVTSGSYFKFAGSLLHYFFNDIRKVYGIAQVIEEKNLKNAIFYDYWLLNTSLSLIYLKRKGKIREIVARTHGFDLYDDRHIEKVVPFKEFKLRFLDRIAPVSKHGTNYLNQQTKNKYREKIGTFYLGVPASHSIPEISQERLVVSCSGMIPLKQVDKIASSIGKLKVSATWIHFGDGPIRSEVESIIETFPSHISAELMGNVPYSEVLSFYACNYISAFISLSTTEGLPVSMMEVQSYGIPIVAPAINGIPEIVNEKTGVLLEPNYSIDQVGLVLDNILTGTKGFNRQNIMEHYMNHFNDRKNYNHFIASFLLKESIR